MVPYAASLSTHSIAMADGSHFLLPLTQRRVKTIPKLFRYEINIFSPITFILGIGKMTSLIRNNVVQEDGN